jgi:hypothetical protein
MSHVSVSVNDPARRRGLSSLRDVTTLREIRPGLWRWTTPHPEWRPGAPRGSPDDWPRAVGSVLCDTADATVFIDPLLPRGGKRFLSVLDEHVRSRDRGVAVLTTIGFHRRSRDQLAERYAATTSRAKKNLPAGVEAFPIRGAGETIFWLPEHRALVPGDRIIGAPSGRLRLCPESWLGYCRAASPSPPSPRRSGPCSSSRSRACSSHTANPS